jgi:hypothetical protein
MALGDGTFDFRWDPAVDADLVEGSHLLVYWGEEWLWTGVILRKAWPAGAVRAKCRSLEWWIGLDKDGPIIEDREYLSGRNKLSNPGFELLDAAGAPLYWATSEGTTWELVTAGQRSGSRAMHVGGDLGKDDVLLSQEHFEAKAGDSFAVSVPLKRAAAAVGKGRVRAIFTGRFDPPDLLEPFDLDVDWTNESQFPADISVLDSDSMIMGPCTRPQVVSNPGFESGLVGWIITSGGGIAVVASGYEGVNALSIQDWSGGTVSILNDADPSSPAIENTYPVSEGERWLFEAMVWVQGGTTGHFDVRVFPNFGAALSVIEGDAAALAGQGWKYAQAESDIKDSGGGSLLVSVNSWGQTAGQFLFDRILATRVRGNAARMTSRAIAVTPEVSYKLVMPVTGSWPQSGPYRDGTVQFSVLLKGTGRPDKVLVSNTLDTSQAATESLLTMDFTPPSGYDSATVSVIAMDLVGGNVIVRKPELRATDTTKYIVDVAAPLHTSGAWSVQGGTATAPAGTEGVYLAVVAEAGATGWYADDASLVRLGPITTAAQLVGDLLEHPRTGLPIATAGTINGPDPIPFDRHIRNMTNRELLVQFSRADMAPPREWRVRPDNVLDWDLPENLYEVRSDFILRRHELIVLAEPDAERSSERQLTDVKVIGAERRRPDGQTVQVVGSASNDPGGITDWFGNPLSRERVVEDSTVDHVDYANAWARYVADQNVQRDNLKYRLADWRAVGRFDLGDWINAEKPEAGLIDLTNEQEIDGEVVYPVKKRAVSRLWRLGAGTFKVMLRKPDGSEPLDLTEWVLWEPSTQVDLELGDALPEFVADPQGPAKGNQFLRFRASAAR